MQRLLVKNIASLHCEEFSEDAHHMRVHTVVKNQPFSVTLGLQEHAGAASSNNRTATRRSTIKSEESLYTFQNIQLDVRLVYDARDGRHERQVECVKVKPFSYKGAIVNSDPLQYALDVTLCVLSSQREFANFRLRIQALDASDGQQIPGLMVYSDPMCTISKVEVLRKKQLEKEQGQKVSRKRPRSDLILDMLTRVEATQRLILQQVSGSSSASSSSNSSNSNATATVAGDNCLLLPTTTTTAAAATTTTAPPLPSITEPSHVARAVIKQQPTSVANGPLCNNSSVAAMAAAFLPPGHSMPDLCYFRRAFEPTDALERFQYHLTALTGCYLDLDPDDRPAKIQRIVEEQSPKEQAHLAEILGTMAAAEVPALQEVFPSTTMIPLHYPHEAATSESSSFDSSTFWDDFFANTEDSTAAFEALTAATHST
jgi:hypothetical protein